MTDPYQDPASCMLSRSIGKRDRSSMFGLRGTLGSNHGLKNAIRCEESYQYSACQHKKKVAGCRSKRTLARGAPSMDIEGSGTPH
jgi:hypothetical protein